MLGLSADRGLPWTKKAGTYAWCPSAWFLGHYSEGRDMTWCVVWAFLGGKPWTCADCMRAHKGSRIQFIQKSGSFESELPMAVMSRCHRASRLERKCLLMLHLPQRHPPSPDSPKPKRPVGSCPSMLKELQASLRSQAAHGTIPDPQWLLHLVAFLVSNSLWIISASFELSDISQQPVWASICLLSSWRRTDSKDGRVGRPC